MSYETSDSRSDPLASARMQCPRCDALYETGAAFCPRDGEALEAVEVADPFEGRVLQDRFEIRERIGAGGMGAVYRAVQRVMDREVAIKVLHRDRLGDVRAVKRFLLEAKATSRLSSPHTVTVFDFGETPDGVLFLAMEYLRGCTLREHMRERGRLSPAEAAEILDQVSESLEEAHAHGIVHRDLKPDNVFLVHRSDGRPFAKVLDFGIARAADLRTGSGITRQGQVPGTPAYMSPEAIQSLPVDARSDIYSLGVLLFEMLSGRTPFRADTPLHVMQKHVVEDPPLLLRVLPEGAVPRGLSDFVRLCLAKNPDGRPRDVSAFRTRLAEAARAARPDPAPGEPDALPARARDEQERPTAGEDPSLDTGALLDSIRPRRHRRLRALVLGATALAVAAAVAWVGLRDPAPSPSLAAEPAATAPVPSPATTPPEEPAPAPSETTAPEPEPEPEPAHAPEPEPVRVELRSTPPGAVVYRDDEGLGLTPLTFDLLPDTEAFSVILRRPGYLPATATIDPADAVPAEITLRPRPAPEPEPEPARVTPEPEPPPAPAPEPEPPSKLDRLLD